MGDGTVFLLFDEIENDVSGKRVDLTVVSKGTCFAGEEDSICLSLFKIGCAESPSFC